jgi:lysophospholipase L1-like esterase
MEVALRVLERPLALRQGYRWLVDTHLVDIPWEVFVERQERIKAVRRRLGMERGRTDPTFGHTYNPGFRIDVPARGSGDGGRTPYAELHLHINSHALRGEEFPAAKPPGEIRIMAIGGSTTAGEEVGENETYPAQLQALLRTRLRDPRIRVINAGIPSYSVKTALLDYALRLYRFAPDFVTVFHGINDLYYHRGPGLKITPRLNYSGREVSPFVFQGDAPQQTWWESVVVGLGDLAARSHLAQRLLRRWRAMTLRLDPPLAAPNAAGIETYLAYYRALLRQIKASGAVPLVMTTPIAYGGSFDAADRVKVEDSFRIWLRGQNIPPEVGARIIDDMNRELLELASEEHARVVDVASIVPRDRENFLDVCHFTREGNRRIAEALARDLAAAIEQRHRASPR